MKFDNVIKHNDLVVIESNISIPPIEDCEVMHIRYLANYNDLSEKFSVQEIDYSSADITMRVIKSVFETQEDLNGVISIEGFDFIVRTYADGHHKDLNDPLVFVPVRRISVLLNNTECIECHKLEKALDVLDQMLTKNASLLVCKKY